MKIPKNVLIIGTADFIRYRSNKKTRATDRTLSNHVLAVNEAHTMLFIFPNKTTGGKKKIEDRHGMQRGRIHTAVSYDVPATELKAVGAIDLIQYSTDWWEGELAKYEHEFDIPPTLYADQHSRFRVMGIKANRGKILTQEGIQG
jgi:hypothetical protein